MRLYANDWQGTMETVRTREHHRSEHTGAAVDANNEAAARTLNGAK